MVVLEIVTVAATPLANSVRTAQMGRPTDDMVSD